MITGDMRACKDAACVAIGRSFRRRPEHWRRAFASVPRQVGDEPVAGPLAAPADRMTFGVVGAVTPLVDIWIGEERLPDHLRAVKPGSKAG